jgi:hypothetical protein
LVKVKPVSVESSLIQLYDPPMERRKEPRREIAVEEAVSDDERVVVVSEPGEECPDELYEMRAPHCDGFVCAGLMSLNIDRRLMIRARRCPSRGGVSGITG